MVRIETGTGNTPCTCASALIGSRRNRQQTGVAYLRAQINAERNRFLVWEVLWLLVGVAAVVPVLMLAAVEFGVALPDDILARAKTFHLQVVSLESTPPGWSPGHQR